MNVRVILSKLIYPHGCLEETIAAYSAFCSVMVHCDDSNMSEIEIMPLSSGAEQADVNRVANEFLNYLLDLSLEHHLQ
jgi:hypothetical protein